MSSALMRAIRLVSLATAGLALGCNFDSAFERYCANNPRCLADAGLPETKPEVAPDLPPDADPDTGPEVAPDVPPDVGPEAPPDLGPYWMSDGFPGPRPSSPPRSCMSTGDCLSGEMCHPTGRVCVSTCRSRGECPPWLDCVDLLDPSGGSRNTKVCACTGTPRCDTAAPGSGYRCNPMDGLCEPSCSSSDDCANFQPARTCDLVWTVCVPSCTTNADCSFALPRCDSESNRCIGCQNNVDCADRSDGLSVCTFTGACGNPSPSPTP